MDVPSDQDADNSSGTNADLQLLWQKGEYSGSPTENDLRYGGIAHIPEDGDSAVGGIVLDNPTWVYPHGDLPVDSLWDIFNTHTGWQAFSDSITDLSAVLVAKAGETLGVDDTVSLAFVLCVYEPDVSAKEVLDSLELQVLKARRFFCDYVRPEAPFCAEICLVGDADGSGIHEIADAVYLVNYVFVPGSPAPTPDPIGSGDADCSGVVEIADAVYLINWIFHPGAPEPGDPNGDGIPDCECIAP
jgi:hypothetical protein